MWTTGLDSTLYMEDHYRFGALLQVCSYFNQYKKKKKKKKKKKPKKKKKKETKKNNNKKKNKK